MRRYDDAPVELVDPSGEGIYVRSDARYGLLGNAFYRAAELLEWPWRDLQVTTVSMIPGEDESWRPVAFRNWRWWLWPLTREPVVYFYCTPKGPPDA